MCIYLLNIVLYLIFSDLSTMKWLRLGRYSVFENRLKQRKNRPMVAGFVSGQEKTRPKAGSKVGNLRLSYQYGK